MAYLKIFPIKVTDKKALDYITNPDKTDEKLLVSSFGCSPETADLEFSMTREMAKKNGMDKGDNLAFHLIQSFKPGEVDAENAHRLGQQFADEVLKGKYEYVISTHVDKNHIHNHIIFNAASFVDHHKYVSNKRSYHKLCRISNRICHENGLATSMPTGEKGKLGLEGNEFVDIMDVKCDPEMTSMIIQTFGFLPGYHMNKQHWITILLDGSVSEAKTLDFLDMSYDMIDGNRGKEE